MSKAAVWMGENWGWLTTIAAMLVSMINAATRHWSTKTGLVKALLFVSEMLSILTSRSTSTAAGKLKLPGQSVSGNPTPGGVPPLGGVLLLLGSVSLLTLTACASTPRGYLNKARIAVEEGDKIARAEIDKRCWAASETCKAQNKKSLDCEVWKKCDKARSIYAASVTTVGGALSVANKALYDLEVE